MKTTGELEQEIRKGTLDILTGEAFDDRSAASYLQTLLQDRGISVKNAINRCNLERGFGYQVLNGTRVPSRNLILYMALEFRFTEEETQRVLKLADRPVLYARCRRDAAVLYALNHDFGPEETAALLKSLGERGLGG